MDNNISDMKETEPDNIWDIFKNESEFIKQCRTNKNKEFFIEYHPTFRLTILQWCLWYVGSGIRAFFKIKFGKHSRKDWAFHKIFLMHEHLPKEIWHALVHCPTGFSDKCKTIHYFARNCYTIDKEQLDQINLWFDEVGGRFTYTYNRDEYGYTPGNYVEFHRKRHEIFRDKAKQKVDPLVQKYHYQENILRDMLEKDLMTEFYDYLKELNETPFVFDDIEIRKKILEIAKIRIESHLIHESLFNDELSKIEKTEESNKRGLTQISNHLWIINIYRKLIKDTFEGKILETFIIKKKINIYKSLLMIPQIKCPFFTTFYRY